MTAENRRKRTGRIKHIDIRLTEEEYRMVDFYRLAIFLNQRIYLDDTIVDTVVPSDFICPKI